MTVTMMMMMMMINIAPPSTDLSKRLMTMVMTLNDEMTMYNAKIVKNIQIFDKVIDFSNFGDKKYLLGVLSQDKFGIKKLS